MLTHQERKLRDVQTIKEELEFKGVKPYETSHGGVRRNAGRPRGSSNLLTKKADKKEKSIKERVLKNVDALLNAQLTLAQGNAYLYEIKMRNVGGRRRPEHLLVADAKRIKAFLDGELEGEYCYITTEKPDNKAIDSLLDRAFGKSTQKSTSDHNFNLQIVEYGKEQLNEYSSAREIETENNNDSLPIYTEGLPAGLSSSETTIQDSSVAPKIGEIEDRPKRANKKGLTV